MMSPMSPTPSMVANRSAEQSQSDQNLDGSNDYSQYGIKDVPKYTVTTAFGKTKTFAGLFPREWLFLVVSLVNILTAVALTLYRLIKTLKDDSTSPDFTFALLLLVNAGFCIYYVIHGVLRERVYELYAFAVATLVVLMYCVLEYFVFNPSGQTTVKLVRLIVAAVMAPPNIILAFVVVQNFGYLEFRIVGASIYLQSLYRQAAIFSCLLKFDLQAAISVVILAVRDGTQLSTLEIVSLSVGLPYSLLWSLLGWITLRKEMKACAWVFALLGLVKPAYYIYKIVYEYLKIDDGYKGPEKTVVNSLIAAGAIGVLVWLLLMIELVYVYRNFGQGLRERAAMVSNENTGLLAPYQNDRASHIASRAAAASRI